MEKVLEIILYALCVIIISFSQAYTIFIASKIICKKDYSHKKLFICFLYFIPISMLVTWIYLNHNELNYIKALISIFSIILTVIFLYKAKPLNTFLIAIVNLFLPFIMDLIGIFIVLILFKNYDSMEDLLNNRANYYIVNILLNLISILFLRIIDRIYSKKNPFKLINFKNIDYKAIMYQGIIVIITLIPSMFLLFSNNYKYSVIFVLINAVQLITVSIFSLTYIRKRISFKDTEIELENTKLHNKALSTINEGIRGFKHDMGNMVQAINGYIAIGNIDGVKEYCQNLLHGFNDINLLSILSPKVIDDPAIYGIVVGKMLYAREHNLNLSLDVSLDVSKINFPSFELSRIIGILLDNAIEASLESDDKKIQLEMYYDESKKADIIIIGNSVKDPSKIDIIKMFEKNYSTKKNPSGFGLYEVLKFLNKNNKGDIVPNIDYDNNFFTQTLIFDK